MPAVRGDGMRGLAVFISDIRNCKSKEAEIKRINKELANIRSKFKGDKTLDGYSKKKYVCKLLFIFLLGHDIDFGHMEAVNLLSSNRYSEKQIGYLFISVLVNTNSELIKLIIKSIKIDLLSRNPVYVNLALQCIANIGSKDMAEAFSNDIPKLLVAPETMDVVKESAALCLLRLFRTSPDVIPSGEWTSRIIHLLNDQHLGVVTAATSLIDALVKRYPEEYKGCISLGVARLSRIVTASYSDLQDYTYYFVPAPWLSVKLLRLLQNYAPPCEDQSVRSRLNECLDTILNKAEESPKSKKVQHSNAKNAVLFEAINLIIHNDTEPNLLVRACNQLGRFLSNRETNLRYLALESMCNLAASDFSHDAVKKHKEVVILSMKMEKDVSVRQQAVDLLYAMCDKSNAEEIVQEMLSYLETADYSIREEMVLKVAILSEKYALDFTWYVDVILNLIRIAGDYVSEEVWYRVIAIVINRDEVQGYAAKTVFEALQAPACHENMVKVGGYILGEFGNLIAGDSRSSPEIQFRLLHSKYHLCSSATRGLLLSTYIKFVNLFPEIRTQIQEVFRTDSNIRSADVELQQRAAEYLHLSIIASNDVLATVLEEMPAFPERESSILAVLKKKKPGRLLDADARVANKGDDSTGTTTATSATAGITAASSSVVDSKKSAGKSSSAAQSIAGSSKARSAVSLPASDDLLDVSATAVTTTTGTAAAQQPQFSTKMNTYFDPLADEDYTGSNTALTNEPLCYLSLSNTINFKKFYCKNEGVLFENDLLQIGVKSEFRKNLGRLCVFYGNKATRQIEEIIVKCCLNSAQSGKLAVQTKPIQSRIDGGSQIQQLFNFECLEDYCGTPELVMTFFYCLDSDTFRIKLPLTINKFFEPTEMNADAFFARWKNLSNNNQQKSQIVFRASYTIDPVIIKAKLTGFGVKVLENVDPNPDNFVCAAILHTKTQQIGCLFRLEPNKTAQMYRLTVRSSKESVSIEICNLLIEQF